ncbi:AAA family ATPase [Larkinella sp. VNQ87]|uniref:AAA family ATPase n=1 Tax=Larkinella sp. VNQ87 TaxID=3400921 RepID=UPI003C1040D3
MLINSDKTAVYFRSLYIRDIKGFSGNFEISFKDKFEKPAQWTVLLGNNNTGKTTTLRILGAISYAEVLSEYTNKYRNIFKKSYINKKKQEAVESQDFFNWLITNKERPMIGPNLFFPFYDYSFFINRVKNKYKIIDLDDFNKRGIKPESIFRYDVLNEYRDDLIIYGYGINRKTSEASILDFKSKHPTANLFRGTELLNFEEWLLQTDYATKVGVEANRKKAEIQLKRLKSLLVSKIFPDIKNIRVNSTENLQSFIEINVGSNWIRFKDLGYGYQATMAWLADLAKRMFDRYPDLENPLHGPAIVLIDEIDLHLHPEWQRKIIKYLSDLFPNTQFIVTAHSPLIVQSAENVNLVMLEKDEATGSINIRQQFGSFQGWTVEEILRELMDLGEKTRSDRYLELMRQFEDALLAENYAGAKTAYDELDKILSPSSHQRKVLQIQMSSLIPA